LRWAAVAAVLVLSGCAGAVVGAGAKVGVAALQERSIGGAVDDATIKLRVKDGLLSKSDRLFLAVGVESVEGRVLLTGNVAKPEDRVEVGRIAWQVPGVREVYNEVEVRDRSSLSNYLRDVRISNELRFKMIADRDVSAINFNVETVNAVVYLTGIALNQAELERVAGHARSIAGVQRVVSYVVLKDDQRRS
jgi:osmotically-inducible protein OsmY